MDLRSKYEEPLKANNSVLYGATWFTNDEKLYYLFGVVDFIDKFGGENL